MNAPLLQVENLTTQFDTRAGVLKAVDGVSFSLARGQILGLVGESGSGKSVTGFSLLGLIDPPGRIVGGSAMLDGQELIGMTQRRLRGVRGRQIAMIFQDPMMTLNPLLSVGTQMGLALRAHRPTLRSKPARQRCIEVLGQVGIPSAAARLDAYPHQFSGGMRQRVAIAIALLHNPAVIIADEPTTALDVSIQAQILGELRELARNNNTALIWISHDLATVSSLADTLLVMYAGRIVEQGPTAAVLRTPRHPYTQGLIDSLPATATPGQPLRQITGTTPSLLALPAGCAFRPRCTFADSACTALPGLMSSDNGERAWRCHHPLNLTAP